MTFEEFIAEMKPFHNHIGIAYDTELVRLIGVHDGEVDYYYIFKSIRSAKVYGAVDGMWYGTAVGHFVSLKGIYPDDRYEYMDKVFAWNGSEPTEDFLTTKDDQPEWIDPDDGI